MPNWCDNNLRITGSQEELDRFRHMIRPVAIDWEGTAERLLEEANMTDNPTEKIRLMSQRAAFLRHDDEPCLFASFYPPPPEVIKEGFSHAGYNWQVDKWGTKWDVSDFDLDAYDELLVIMFSTAWAPPLGWVVHVGKMFPELRFELKYFEGGAWFAGTAVAEDGEYYDTPADDIRKFAEEEFGIEFDDEEEA